MTTDIPPSAIAQPAPARLAKPLETGAPVVASAAAAVVASGKMPVKMPPMPPASPLLVAADTADVDDAEVDEMRVDMESLEEGETVDEEEEVEEAMEEEEVREVAAEEAEAEEVGRSGVEGDPPAEEERSANPIEGGEERNTATSRENQSINPRTQVSSPRLPRHIKRPGGRGVEKGSNRTHPHTHSSRTPHQ
jgi:hypothetical protein